jgi:diacylglycerol kinase family enzyme
VGVTRAEVGSASRPTAGGDAAQPDLTAPAPAPAPFAPPPEVAADAPLCIVFNARSGHHAGDDLEKLIGDTLAGTGRRHRLFRIDDPRKIDATAKAAVDAARADNGIVVAAGGDGTLNAVAQHAVRNGVAFGVLPQGTFNYFARANGISQDAEAALRALLHARPRAVQVGRINERIFLVNASLGLYPQLLEDREAYKRQHGRSRWAALWSGLLTLLRERRQLSLRIESDGGMREVRTPTLFIGNNPLQLEQVGVPEATIVAANCQFLSAIMVRPISTVSMLWLALQSALGRLGDADQVESFVFRRLRVSTIRPQRLKVAFDGEVARVDTPIHFEASPSPLWLMVPRPADRAPVE